MTTLNKPKLIAEIVKVTGQGEKYFDKLNDYSEEKLKKILEISKLLK
jgi:hypothetical protein